MVNSQTFSFKIAEIGSSTNEDDELIPTIIDETLESFFSYLQDAKKVVISQTAAASGDIFVMTFLYTDAPRSNGLLSPLRAGDI